MTRSLLRPSPHMHGRFWSKNNLSPVWRFSCVFRKQASIRHCWIPVLRNGIAADREQIAFLALQLYVLYEILKKPSLLPPFLLIETLLISCSSSHCWPIRRVIHLGDDDNSRWHTVIPSRLRIVWSSIGVIRNSVSYLVIKQTVLHSNMTIVSTIKKAWRAIAIYDDWVYNNLLFSKPFFVIFVRMGTFVDRFISITCSFFCHCCRIPDSGSCASPQT